MIGFLKTSIIILLVVLAVIVIIAIAVIFRIKKLNKNEE